MTIPFSFWKTVSSGSLTNLDSIVFNGTNQYFDAGTVAQIAYNQPISFSFWLYSASASGSQDYGYISNRNDLSSGLNLENYQNVIYWQILTDRLNYITINYGVAGLITANTWHFIVATYDGTATTEAFNFYVDGVAVIPEGDSSSGILTTPVYTIDTQIGNAPSNDPGAYFQGNMDEFAVWSVALSQADVTRLYNSGTPSNLAMDAESASLQHWWRFESSSLSPADTATTVYDRVGSANLTGSNFTSGSFSRNVP